MEQFTQEQLLEMDKDALVTLILSMQGELQKVGNQLELLTEQILIMNQRTYGRKSDKNIIDGQMTIESLPGGMELVFNEAECGSDDSKEPTVEEITVSAHSRKKPSSSKEAKLEGLPTQVIHSELSDDELAELFPEGYKELPEKVVKKLAVIPRTMMVEEHHIHCYASKDNTSDVMAYGKYPDYLLRGSIVTPSLMSTVMSGKYDQHQPLERQSKAFKQEGVNLETNTLCNWMIKGSEEYLSKIYERMHGQLYEAKVIHADETTVRVNDKHNPSASKNYMWVYCNNTDTEKKPVVIYDYERTRRADHPREFLKNYSGVVVTDGYEVYHTIGNEREDLTIAGCWVHAKRKFSDITKAMGKVGATGTIAKQAEDKISDIFHVNKKLNGLSRAEIEKGRKLDVKPKVNAFFEWVHDLVDKKKVRGQTLKALEYCINQEKYLRVFPKNGLVPMDNNAAERAIRPFTLGRKNWTIISSEKGAKASAVIYSIVETAKANNLRVYNYLEFVFSEMMKRKNDETDDYLDELLPWSQTVQAKCCIPK